MAYFKPIKKFVHGPFYLSLVSIFCSFSPTKRFLPPIWCKRYLILRGGVSKKNIVTMSKMREGN